MDGRVEAPVQSWRGNAVSQGELSYKSAVLSFAGMFPSHGWRVEGQRAVNSAQVATWPSSVCKANGPTPGHGKKWDSTYDDNLQSCDGNDDLEQLRLKLELDEGSWIVLGTASI